MRKTSVGPIIESKRRTSRFANLAEVITWAAVISGVLLIQLPLEPKPDRLAVYGTVAAAALFNLWWHRIVRLSLRPLTKNFIQSLFGLGIVFLIVFFTGGAASYLNILYILPNLGVAFTGNLRNTAIMFFLTSILIVAQIPLFGANPSLSVLFVWFLLLVVLYGRFIARLVVEVRGRTEKVKIEKIKSVAQLKDEFIYIVSHELRTPVTAIQGYLDLMLMGSAGSLTSEQKRLAREIFQKNEILKNMIDDLLDLSRIERGVLKLNNEKIEIASFVHELCKRFQTILGVKHIEVAVDSIADSLIIFADRQRLSEVIKNLLDTHAKLTPAFGQIRFSCQKVGEQIRFEVGSSGRGVAKEEECHLFEKFYQPQGNGEFRGLELFATKKILERMDGQIWAKCNSEEGLLFTFTLPQKTLETVEI